MVDEREQIGEMLVGRVLLLSRTDAALNRAGFEVSVHKAVTAAEDSFEARMLENQQRAAEQQLEALATALVGKIAAP
jgi:hypothetical protein